MSKKKKNKKGTFMILLSVCIVCGIGGGIFAGSLISNRYRNSSDSTQDVVESVETKSDLQNGSSKEELTTNTEAAKVNFASGTRTAFVETLIEPSFTPNVAPYTYKSDLSDVYLHEFIDYWDDEAKKELAEDGFLIENYSNDEIFSTYEINRYNYVPNFVTVDSMMHTYHLYYSYLLRTTEKEYLFQDLVQLTSQMLQASSAQYEASKGTEWEKAALTNYAFFAVAEKLLDPDFELPSEIKSVVEQEVTLINEANGIAVSPLFSEALANNEDYSQYKPRGYYESDEKLIRYFKTMMWYGRRNFVVSDDTQLRCSTLMTLALRDSAFEDWNAIYSVTTFFVGASDDNGYYEFLPMFEQAYGKEATLQDILTNSASYQTFCDLAQNMEAPKINSVLVEASDSDEEAMDKVLGFRFMGQRFTLDAAVFQNLIYRSVQANPNGEFRMLPDAMDIPAVLGSKKALSILEQQGDTSYENYSEHMNTLQNKIAEAPAEAWNVNLYSNWLYTLKPVLEQKGEGYPQFMQSDKWQTKNLITFLGSYAELKHDTILYAKQAVAEMGGGDIDEVDDRGYVEPEVLVYARLENLVKSTSDGMSYFGYVTESQKEDLAKLQSLAGSLKTISIKELQNEVPTEEEFELIRTYGGQLEHFWAESHMDELDDQSYPNTLDFPGAIIADIATDPNGSVLEVGTGGYNTITVIVKVDDKIKIAKGAIYSFYQFEQPLEKRLTDTEWRYMMGLYYYNEDGDNPYADLKPVDMPAWESEIIYAK